MSYNSKVKEKEFDIAIEIISSPERVWNILVDSQNFPKWNPIIRYVIGELRENIVLKALVQISQKQYDSKIKILSLIPSTELRWKIMIPTIRLGRLVFFSKEIEQTFLIRNLPNSHGVHNNSVWFVQKVSAKIYASLLRDMATAETTAKTTKKNIPNWTVSGDWFDVCNCNIPCPCEFAQAPTYGNCDSILAYNIKKGSYGDTHLDGLNVLALASFKGNLWAGDGKTKVNLALFFDEKANEQQRDALNIIFSGKAGGFMAEFAMLIGEVRGIDFAPIKFDIADDLSYWSAEIPGKVLAKAEALTGPTTPPGKSTDY